MVEVLFNFIMWWFYLISYVLVLFNFTVVVLMQLVGFFFTVLLLSFINKRAIFALKVNVDIDVDNKSEMNDILNLHQKK